MNRREFMEQLKKRLRKLPFDEVRDAVDYYEQYFDDAGEENEQSVLDELGSPANVASQIITDFALKGAGTEKSAKHGLSTVWFAILAVFASPIALPLALAVVIIALALVIVIVAVILSLGAAGAGLLAGGIVYAIMSIPAFVQSVVSALLILGIGLMAIGIGASLLITTVTLSKKCFNWLAKRMGMFILRRNGK